MRRAKGKVAQAREAEHIAREDRAKQARITEEVNEMDRRAALIRTFPTDYPDTFEDLRLEAEAAFPEKTRGRGLLVQGKLYELIERRVDAGS